jgi:L-lactate permease
MKKSVKKTLNIVWRTLFYTFIIIALVYLFHYSHMSGSTFIYNEF